MGTVVLVVDVLVVDVLEVEVEVLAVEAGGAVGADVATTVAVAPAASPPVGSLPDAHPASATAAAKPHHTARM